MSSSNFYKKISNSHGGLDIMANLVQSGVLPESFKVRTGTLDVTATNSGASAPVIDDSTGEAMQLSQGERVFLACVIETAAETSGSTFRLGLGATATGAIGDNLMSAAGAADTITLQSDIPLLVGATNDHVIVSVATANGGTGTADVVVVSF